MLTKRLFKFVHACCVLVSDLGQMHGILPLAVAKHSVGHWELN